MFIGSLFAVSWSTKAGAQTEVPPKVERNVYYQVSPSKLLHAHTLDVYFAQSEEDLCPIVVFVHAGAWQYMDKSHRHAKDTGEFFAKHGIHAVVINHRNKNVQHPSHIQDVAKAFSWVVDHVGEIGGHRKAIFVAGLSSGAHLATLLATDAAYLAKYKLDSKQDIAGVVAISGVYDLDLRWRSGRIFHTHLVEKPFGKDRRNYRAASPIHKVNDLNVPMLLLSARSDPKILKRQSKAFYRELLRLGKEVEWWPKVWGTHLTVMYGLTHHNRHDAQAILEFVFRRTRERLHGRN